MSVLSRGGVKGVLARTTGPTVRSWAAAARTTQRRWRFMIRGREEPDAERAGNLLSNDGDLMKKVYEDSQQMRSPGSGDVAKSVDEGGSSLGTAAIKAESSSRLQRRSILEEAIRRSRESAEQDLAERPELQAPGDTNKVPKAEGGEEPQPIVATFLDDNGSSRQRTFLMASDLKGKFRGDPYENPDEPLPVYPRTRARYKRARSIMRRLNFTEGLGMKRSGRSVIMEKIPQLRAGDVVRLKLRDIYSESGHHFFTGVVIAKSIKGLGSSFILRNTVDDLPVERGFHMYSPTIMDAEIVTHKKVRDSHLYYLRKLDHRRSNVGDAFARIQPTKK
eukprot:Plantae.Rhodophyta-Purpureofilum_apyrenoidigerum.ctg25184.p1 GENE.Plantae.Rhodophyta-Purpureofilum_apyrenoidigerum.ctg25184~~Plantae.Rhodophyta-Purpureofilum_apyrenoidigerum.ctg25184.p1  ORF type:complete len:334 (-),score=41.33 Plantae.Rhodophyta-Purpureofilum_apyrenoidigerum.ctg25184:234-1235(-)